MISVRATDPDQAVEVWRAAEAGRGLRPSRAALDELSELVRQGLCVVTLDPDPIAMAVGEPADEPEVLLLTRVAVLPFRQRQGVGATTVEALADLAWEQGLRSMVVAEPHPFLEAIGFEGLRAELEAPVREVRISAGIRLGQLLKLAGLVETGSEGKALLAEDGVEVNGEVETRRGRQLVDGDEVRARDQAIRVRLDQR